eukprot:gene22223-15591_t
MPDRSSFAPAARVVVGGHKDVVNDECKAFLEAKWAGSLGRVEVIADDSGAKVQCKDYETLCNAVRYLPAQYLELVQDFIA